MPVRRVAASLLPRAHPELPYQRLGRCRALSTLPETRWPGVSPSESWHWIAKIEISERWACPILCSLNHFEPAATAATSWHFHRLRETSVLRVYRFLPVLRFIR